MTVSNGRNTDKSDLGYRIGYSPNGTDNDLATNEYTGWQCLTSFQMPQVVSVQTLYLKNRKATCNTVSLSKSYITHSFCVLQGSNIWWSWLGLLFRGESLRSKCTFFSTLIKAFFLLFCQEKLLHRISDFHATEDNRGITQRSKRSPGKQPETGTRLFVGFIVVQLSRLSSSHLGAEAVCWHCSFIV